MQFFSWFWNRGKPSFLPETCDRETVDVTRGLTPQKVDAIMRAANGGDIRGQCRLAAELLEHNIEIAQAVGTRINAVLGQHWSFEPGNDTPEAKQAAAALSEEIRSAVDYIVSPSMDRESTGLASQIIKLEVDGEVKIIRP